MASQQNKNNNQPDGQWRKQNKEVNSDDGIGQAWCAGNLCDRKQSTKECEDLCDRKHSTKECEECVKKNQLVLCKWEKTEE